MRLIDADAAIDTLKELTANGTNKGMVFGEDAVHRIEMLPSVQPDTTTHDSIPAETGKNDGDRTSGDCISIQQAIDALEQIFDRCEEIEAHLPEGDPDRTGYKMYPDYMTVWKYLHQLPSAQPEQRWIPCSERLPEDFQKVLVFWWEHSEPMIDTAFWQKDAKRFDGQHWVRMEDKVTHWMPLPKPPAFNEVEE